MLRAELKLVVLLDVDGLALGNQSPESAHHRVAGHLRKGAAVVRLGDWSVEYMLYLVLLCCKLIRSYISLVPAPEPI